MHNKKGNRQTSFFAKLFHKLVFERGYGQRRQKKEKGNKCDKNEEKRREKKRQQMNKSMSKGTYRGNACMEKGISWRVFFDTKGRWNCSKKIGDQENKRSNKKGNEKMRWNGNVMNKNKKWSN